MSVDFRDSGDTAAAAGGVAWSGDARGGLGAGLRAALTELGCVLLPTECAGCGAWDEVVCDRCLALLLGEPHRIDLEVPGVPGFAVANYDGAMRRFVLVGKHETRLDLRAYFAAAGENAVFLAARGGFMRGHFREVFVIPAPSTTPGNPSPVVGAFAAGIMSGLVKSGVARQSGVLEVLKMRPGAKKQAGLGYSQRVSNRHHQMTLITSAAARELSGAAVVLVDDVTATGSTLREMVRVLQHAGAEILAGFVFASSQFSQ